MISSPSPSPSQTETTAAERRAYLIACLQDLRAHGNAMQRHITAVAEQKAVVHEDRQCLAAEYWLLADDAAGTRRLAVRIRRSAAGGLACGSPRPGPCRARVSASAGRSQFPIAVVGDLGDALHHEPG